jgi:SAM-dependent methyltransferase
MPGINRTEAFYCSDSPSLLWELTICESLANGDSGYARALNQPAPYGELLGRFLRQHTSLPAAPERIVEVGGGYGSLMAGLLTVLAPRQVTMVDISAFLLARQRQRLGEDGNIAYVCADIFAYLEDLDEPVDLLIANEIIADLPTITGLTREQLAPLLPRAREFPPLEPLAADLGAEQLLAEAARLVATYDLEIDDQPEPFNLNVGGLQLVEKLAAREIKRVFISEHGADTELPYPFSLLLKNYQRWDKNPKRIQLKDHDEYTIRFDHLAAVASRCGYTVDSCHMMEMLDVRFDDEINYLLTTEKPTDEAQEILLEFLEHVAEYQVMLLGRR